jgi:hypothetical protein
MATNQWPAENQGVVFCDIPAMKAPAAVRWLAGKIAPGHDPNGLACLQILERRYGYASSSRTNAPVDGNENPTPWYTYPAIAYLSQLDFSESAVFEYGAGNSTLWWGARGRRVVSVESARDWAWKVSRQADALPVEIVEASGRDEYVMALDGVFEVIVVDGDWRGACAERAVTALAPGGLIVLDNADWYPDTCAMLRATNLIQVDFSGFGPVNPYTWTTSLFLHRDFRLRPVGERQPVPAVGSLTFTGDDDWIGGSHDVA